MARFRIGMAACRHDPAMGFNRRKMEADRKAKADAVAGARRATDAQAPSAKSSPGTNAKPGGWDAHAVRPDDWRRASGPQLVAVGPLLALPHVTASDQPNARAVLYGPAEP